MEGKNIVHDNYNKRFYQFLSEYHFLKPITQRQYSTLSKTVRNDLRNLSASCTRLEERIIKLDKIIEDVKRLIETKKRSET